MGGYYCSKAGVVDSAFVNLAAVNLAVMKQKIGCYKAKDWL
jgi:hypothetical protein